MDLAASEMSVLGAILARWGAPVIAPPDRTLRGLLEMGERGVGASTGFMAADRGHWPRLLTQAGSISTAVVELSALSAPELPDLFRFLGEGDELEFDYVSVHGPAKGLGGDWARLATELEARLPAWVSAVVMHPDSLAEPGAFAVLGSRLILENMDGLKADARTVAELTPYFEALPEAGFCFDLAHAQMVDPTMTLAHELLDAFGERLREVHLSSIRADGTHLPLRAEDVRIFQPVLERCREVPWVLEAPLPA